MERLNECRKAKLEADRITKQIVELQEMGAPASEINKLWQMLLQERTRWLKQFMEIDRIFGKMSDANGYACFTGPVYLGQDVERSTTEVRL